MFLLTLVKVVPFQLSSCFQMFFLTRPPLYLFTSYPIEGGGGNLSNVLFQPGQFAPSHLCLWGEGESQMFFLTRAVCTFSPLPVGRGGILNVPFKPRQIVSFHLCLRGGGGDLHWLSLWDYIMSWFTLSILYIIFSSFYLILSCERVSNILFFSLSAGQGQSPIIYT